LALHGGTRLAGDFDSSTRRDEMKGRRWALLGMWILSLAAISFYGGAVSYGFFFSVTLLPVVSFVYLLAVAVRFKVYQEAGSRNMVCGQPMPYFFVLQNEDCFAFTGVSVRMYSDFSYVEELPDHIEYELLPGDRFTYETKLVCRYRGEYEVGVKAVVLTDFFRLFRFSCPVPGQIKALVLPKIVRTEELAGIADLPVPARREAFADTEPDVVVRDYAEGDSLRQIHWKASAREGKLKVRTRTGEEKEGIYLFCDTKRYGRDRKEYLPLENKLLEALLALGFFFAGRDMEYTVYYGQEGIVESRVRGMGEFDDFYTKVSGIVFGEGENVQDVLEQTAERGVLWGAQVIFAVLHELDDRIMEITERLSAGGAIVVVYCITDRDQKDYVRQGSERRRIIVIPVEAGLEGRL